jgi:hypothetical protein
MIYIEKPEKFIFRHWMDITVPKIKDNIDDHMNRCEWIARQCGEIGHVWGFDKINSEHDKICTYSYRFKHKNDAVAFKLKWGDDKSLFQ